MIFSQRGCVPHFSVTKVNVSSSASAVWKVLRRMFANSEPISERERESGSWIDSNLLVRRWMTSLGILGRQQWMDSQISLWMITKLLLSGGFDALLEIITLRINGSVNHQQAWIKPWQRPAVTERPKQAAGPACRTVSPSGSSVYRWCTPEGYHHRTVVAHVTDTLKNSNTLYAAVTPPLNSF